MNGPVSRKICLGVEFVSFTLELHPDFLEKRSLLRFWWFWAVLPEVQLEGFAPRWQGKISRQEVLFYANGDGGTLALALKFCRCF